LFSSLLLLLPWLPGRLPAAFLLWTGHLAAAVWIAVALAMLFAKKGSGSPFPGDARKRAPGPLFFAAAVACVLYICTASHLGGIITGGDEPHYLVITQSLLNVHELQLEKNYLLVASLVTFNGLTRTYS